MSASGFAVNERSASTANRDPLRRSAARSRGVGDVSLEHVTISSPDSGGVSTRWSPNIVAVPALEQKVREGDRVGLVLVSGWPAAEVDDRSPAGRLGSTVIVSGHLRKLTGARRQLRRRDSRRDDGGRRRDLAEDVAERQHLESTRGQRSGGVDAVAKILPAFAIEISGRHGSRPRSRRRCWSRRRAPGAVRIERRAGRSRRRRRAGRAVIVVVDDRSGGGLVGQRVGDRNQP